MNPSLETLRAFASYWEKMSWSHCAPALIVIIVLLTHFSIGSTALAKHLSYADVLCFSGIGTAAAILLFRKSLAQGRAPAILIATTAFLAGIAFLASQAIAPEHDLWNQAAFASALCEGAFIATASVFWFDFFIDESIETVLLSLSASFLGGCALAWFFLGVLPNRFTAGMLLLIIGASASLVHALAGKNAPPPDQTGPRFVPLLSATFTLCFSAMFSLSLAGRVLWHSDDVWLVVAPSAFIVLIAVLLFRKTEASILPYVALTLSLLSVLLSSFSPVDAIATLVVATNGFAITVSFSIAFMLKAARGKARAPHETGAVLLMVVFTGCVAGRYCAELSLAYPDGTLRTAIAIVLAIAIVISVTAGMNDASLSSIVRKKFRKASGEAHGTDDKERIDAFAESRGLGPREREALQLLLQGCSAHEVAGKMFIADGTAKAHIRHVYRKFDVHDRQELFDTVRKGIEADARKG